MRKRDTEIARALKQHLAAAVALVDFRVFGSRARGTADAYSDMDVFIEVESLDHETKERILDIVWEVSFDQGLVIAPLIFTRDEIENTAMRSSDIVRNIVREGVRI
jgi:predicted nucleotidyltransferase